MADILIDKASDIVSIALASSNMPDEFALVKDYANFRLIVELKKWATLRLSENADESAKSTDITDKKSAIIKMEPINEGHVPTPPPKMVKCEAIDKERSDSPDLSEQDDSNDPTPNVDPDESASPSEPEDGTASDDSYSPFNSKSKQRKAAKKKRKKPDQLFQCEKCDYKTVHRKHFERHQRAHSAGTLREKAVRKKAVQLQCDKCDYNTFRRDHFMRHQWTHSDEKRFSCTICSKRYKDQKTVDHHVRAYHLGEKNYSCEKCDFKCARTGTLRTHMAKHSEAKPFKCQYCDYAAKTKTVLQFHERRMHSESIQYFHCDKCRFKTLVEERYRKHKEAHENNSGEVCNHCGKIFLLKRDLRDHLRFCHQEGRKKIYSCPQCGKALSSLEYLRGHMGTHTGDREYRCRLCGSGYTVETSLSKHFRNHHPTEKIFRCAPCDFETDKGGENNRHMKTLSHLRNIGNSQA